MEKIQLHELKDIYRLDHGIILEVNKYKPLGNFLSSEYKKKSKKVKGLTQGYELKEEYKGYPKGTIILYDHPVEAKSDIKNFTFELKLSGGSFLGDYLKHRNIYQQIEKIIASYEAE
ncbi:hypothetical protein [Brevibacillus laterosporus]|uniref:Uncharacterized protein n=1 Tax=Brevibacillus laterosporus TaxID=1465 RepID=A0A518VCB2_BRELA|nr:hypothetical protein [Brevibacillus laterosporus]MBG9776094.1 hypothetical protein [Brevibacillus laterosporus]QDX94624.1 hypothetical protein EEL30_21520 [Brevibacillus laterosporus]